VARLRAGGNDRAPARRALPLDHNCYDPLGGAAPESPPTGQRTDVASDLLLPFYGTIAVDLAAA